MAAPAKRKVASNTAALQAHPRDYSAAVRYKDGRSEMFCVRQADSLADARAMVLAELIDVKTIMLSIKG